MANSGLQTLTGKGLVSLSAVTYLKEITWDVKVSGNILYYSTSNPKRLFGAGWFALGYHNVPVGTVTDDHITWWKFIEMNGQDIVFPASTVFGDSLFYQIDPGVTMYAEVYW